MKNILKIITEVLLLVALVTGCKTVQKPNKLVTIPLPIPEGVKLGGSSPSTNLFAVQLAWGIATDTNVSYSVYCGSNSPPYIYSKRFITTNSLNYFGTNWSVFIDRLSPTNTYRFTITARSLTGLESDFVTEAVIPLPLTNIVTVTTTPLINTNGTWTSLVTNLVVKIISPSDTAFFRGAVHITGWDTNNTVAVTTAVQQAPDIVNGTWTELADNISFVLTSVPVDAQLSSSLNISRWSNAAYQRATNGVPATFPIFHMQ